MAFDPEKLLKDRRDALFMAINAENALRREVIASSLLLQYGADQPEVARQKIAARHYLDSLEHFEAMDTRCREVGVQP